jgi:predicted AlkP superfamily pyrophosphatase or phosphodiesterase
MSRFEVFTVILLSFSSAAAIAAAPAQAVKPDHPKLILAVSIDQFSSNLYLQYRDHLARDGGLERLTQRGIVFPNGYQTHAITETCVGHSTILTGRHPSATGIIANDWLDEAGKDIYCAQDDGFKVPGRADVRRGPAHLRVPTFGEFLKTQDAGSRTVAVSGKDRAAITMSGHAPDAVFWWDDDLGFNTYVAQGVNDTERLAPVRSFNEKLAKKWQASRPKWKRLQASCSALDATITYDPKGSPLTVHHHVPPEWKPADPSKPFREDAQFQDWIRASPLLDRLTLDLAETLIDRFRLGKGASTDLLALSLSATDGVGHMYGTQGPEMCDQVAHLDQALGSFFRALDSRKISYVVVLTADHGGIDTAERASLNGFPAERIDIDFAKNVNAALRAQSLLTRDAFKFAAYGLYLFGGEETSDARERIIRAAMDYLRTQPNVVAAFSKRELLETKVRAQTPPDELTLAERFAENIDAERSPDILIAFKPYATYGAVEMPYLTWGHGSPWNYDRRVPILFYWPGAEPHENALPIETVDIVPTLAALAGVRIPEVDGRCIDLNPRAASTCQ